MKTCTKCGIEKPLDEFTKWGKHREGLRSQCKSCRRLEGQKRFKPLSRPKEEYLHLHKLQLTETSETKLCVACCELKHLKEFSPNKTYRKNVFSRCLSCERLRALKRYSSEKNRSTHLKRNYNLSDDGYDKLSESQKGLCAICGSSEGRKGVRLFVDHNHTTGKIRGLLCQGCNTGLGMFGDDPERLEAAAAYLRKNNNG